MSATRTTSEQDQVETKKCKNCETVLPPQAQFCGTCGKRVEQSDNADLSARESDIHKRYRITSLIRRRPHVQLLLGHDIRHQRPVVIRDIDMTGLDDRSRREAWEHMQREYDLLRLQRIQDLMPLIDLSRFQSHIYTVGEWPFTPLKRNGKERPIYTLEDLLQSGIGLPDEPLAALWIERLARTAARLHEQGIVIGDLDPFTIIVSSTTYEGLPMLMVSWLPERVRRLFPRPEKNAATSYFYAPESQIGDSEPRSDVYSLGAILYLLLTGSAPMTGPQRKKQTLRRPREVNHQISQSLDALVMKALAAEAAERFESAQALAEALREHITQLNTGQAATRPLLSTVLKGRRDHNQHEAIRPHRPVSPFITRVLKDPPLTPPQTPRPTREVALPPGEDRATTNTTAQDSAEVTPVAEMASGGSAGRQAIYPIPIEDIETVIIDAREFEAALAQATQPQPVLIDEADEVIVPAADEASDTAEPARPAEVEARDSETTAEEQEERGKEEPSLFRPPTPLDAASSAQAGGKEEPSLFRPPTPLDAVDPSQLYNAAPQSAELQGVRSAQVGSNDDIPTIRLGERPIQIPEPPAVPGTEQEGEEMPVVQPDMAQEVSEQVAEPSDAEDALPALPASAEPLEAGRAPIEEVETRPVPVEEMETQPVPDALPSVEQVETRPVPVEEMGTQALPEVQEEGAQQREGAMVGQSAGGVVDDSKVAASDEAEAAVSADQEQGQGEENPLAQQLKKLFTGPLPTLPRLVQEHKPDSEAGAESKESLLERLRRFVLGQQQHNTAAAALIETPLRVQPDQGYAIRIQIMGRDMPRQAGVGLSGLVKGKVVHIEVRSALFHNYAYIVQQADVQLPGEGFAAAVTIPMHPLSDGSNARRERLHIFFMDEQRNPLYEKPFAIEVFISPLVQAGREGHNVLPIPL